MLFLSLLHSYFHPTSLLCHLIEVLLCPYDDAVGVVDQGLIATKSLCGLHMFGERQDFHDQRLSRGWWTAVHISQVLRSSYSFGGAQMQLPFIVHDLGNVVLSWLAPVGLDLWDEIVRDFLKNKPRQLLLSS